MKNVTPGIFGLLLLSLGNPALADANWHTVLSCDGGAAVIDNRATYSVGRINSPATTAQIVIRNPQIVQYFAGALAMDSQFGDGYRLIDGQFISALPPQATFAAGEQVTNFTVYGIYGAKVTVTRDGAGLRLNVVSDQNQTANWHFQNCARSE